ncbi:DUF4118 domain-containing protein [Pseudonocardia sp. P1]
MPATGSTTMRWAGAVGPVVVAYGAGELRAVLANTSAALVLVLVIVATAVAGDRVAGLLAAVSSAAAFDFFLTVPYYAFAIRTAADIETAVLLLAIGVAVTEICWWGRRHRSRSEGRQRYLEGVAHAARMAADGSSARDLVATVESMIVEVLDVDGARYEHGPVGTGDAPGSPVLHRDGSLTWGRRRIDMAREGLPTMDVIELPAGSGPDDGRFLLTASTRVRRPGPEQLLVAVTLAEQVRAPGNRDEHPGA